MTRLKRLLLASTVAPAMMVAPFAQVFAQAPNVERHGARGPQHEASPHEAAPHAGGPAPHAEAPPHAAPPTRESRGGRDAPAAHEAGRPTPAERGGATANERGREPPRSAERQAPAAGAHAPAAPHEAPAHAEAAHKEGHAERNGEAAHPTPPSARHGEAGRPAAAPNRGPEGEHAGAAPTRGHEATHDQTHNTARPGAPATRNDDAARPGTPAARNGEATRPGAVPAHTGDAGHRPHEGDATRPGTPPTHAGEAAQPGTPVAPGSETRRGEPARAGAVPNPGEPSRPNEGSRPGQPGQPGGPQGRFAPGGANPGEQSRRGISPGGAAAIGAAAGFAGGFLAASGAQHLDEIRRDRREFTQDGRTYIREPGRTIVEDNGRAYIVHDEDDRFRELGYEVHRERSGRDTIDVIDRPGGVRILTFTDPDGRMIRRVRRYPDGHEVVLIDNGYDGRVRPPQDDIVDLPPPSIDIPRDRYIVDYADADENVIYDTFVAPPLQPPPQRYTLDQIRYSPDIRRYVRSVDINTINFDTGSWVVPASATSKLQALGTAIKRAVDRNPNAVFLVEGYTDATGNPTDNLSLSDRRAQSVATILSRSFGVPPENLTTQGYGQQNLKVNTQGASAANRRVVVQNITPLLAAGGAPPR